MRILAVDDDPTFLLLLKSVLVDAGYTDVVTAPEADAALELIEQADEPFDCFLLDIRMPGTTGIELCRQIREMPAYSITPILILTVVIDDETVDEAFSAGATDYVTKPLKGLELGARIRAASLLAEQTRKSMGLQRSAEHLQARLDALMKKPLSEALPLEACVAQRDLENILYLLPKKAYAMSVYALRISAVEKYHELLDTQAFQVFLDDIAAGISSELAPRRHYVSYAGDGVFGCVLLGSARRGATRDDIHTKGVTLRATIPDNSAETVDLAFSRGLDWGLQSGQAGADALRLVIAKASENAMLDRLQRNLDTDRLGQGTVVPRRPGLAALLTPRETGRPDA